MSFEPTDFRSFSKAGGGGRVDFRGVSSWPNPELTKSWRGQIGTVFYRSLGVARQFIISGVTKDSSGNPLGFCRVESFTTVDDVMRDSVMSDASGNYTLTSPSPTAGPFYLVAYKPGSPDVAGTTLNTLTAV